MVLGIFQRVFTPSPYQHFCSECPVHLGIHVVVVVLYKLVIPVGIILGAYRDEQRHHLEDICIQNYIFQYMYHIKTQIHIFSAGSRGAHRKHGNIGLSSLNLDIHLCSWTNFCRNRIEKQNQCHLAWPFYYQTDFTLLEFGESCVICFIFMFWVSIRSGTSWEANHHSTKNKLRNFTLVMCYINVLDKALCETR